MTRKKKYIMHVISHTHWDREWYQPFAGYRRRLVYQVEKLMDLLEARRAYRCFHLDGQTSVVLDYLEIKPNDKKRLERHIQDGRIIIGPWFVMPDEGLVSGESLVRNLLSGHRLCRDLGAKPMPVGYVSDVFGHVSQLPQILAGFGIDCAWLHRGTPPDANKRSEMIWQGADGTEVLVVKAYVNTGYNDFLYFRNASQERISEYEKNKLALAGTPVLFAMDGNDHQPARWDTSEAIARMNIRFKNVVAVHSSLPRFFFCLKKALAAKSGVKLKRLRGELRYPAKTGRYNEVFYGAGSARLPLKQANDANEQLLARLAEFFHAWAVWLGAETQKPFLDHAWQYLLLNQPHDSICGCSSDQVHRDMLYRFDQARIVATDSISESIQDICQWIDPGEIGNSRYMVSVFNGAARPLGPVVNFTFELPAKAAQEMRRKFPAPRLLDSAGHELNYQLLDIECSVRSSNFMYKTPGPTPAMLPHSESVDRYRIAAEVHIPALGYKSWYIDVNQPATKCLLSAIRPVFVDAKKGFMENEAVRLSIRKNGCLDIYDKKLRKWFRGLHSFEDSGDIGHGWDHIYPTRDTVIKSAGFRRKLKIVTECSGILQGSLRTSFYMEIPADIVDQQCKIHETGVEKVTRRSRRVVKMPIESIFTLRAGSRRIDCRTMIHNPARRHRLRVVFPTGFKSRVWHGDTAFDVVKRRVKLINTKGWKEKVREESPIKNFAAVYDGRRGLAILTKGLNEAAVQDNPTRSIALTLFRSFIERLVAENTVDSLLLGDLTMEYAVMPFSPVHKAPFSDILSEVDSYKLQLVSYSRELKIGGGAQSIPAAIDPLDSPELMRILKNRPKIRQDLKPDGIFFQISAPLVLSTVKISEDSKALIIRFWNPLTHIVPGSLRLAYPFVRAVKATMLEYPISRLSSGPKGHIQLVVRPKEIMTIRIEH